MKKFFIASAVAAALNASVGTAAAAEQNELTQIREQLQGLMQRVDKLEQENTALKSENQNLKAQDDYLKAETRGLRKDSATTTTAVNNLKGAEWASRVAVTGDLRYRYEYISDETTNAAGVQTTADRYRDRIRGRLAVVGRPTDTISVGLGLATTEGGDPRSSNQSLDGTFSRKSLDLDLAYFDWKFASWGNFVGGKMKQPFLKPAQTLFWDNDINPEGLAVSFAQGMWFGTVYNYWIDEVSGAENTVTADAHLAGGQVGVKLPIGASTLTLAAHYYDLSAGQGRRGIFFNCANPTLTLGANGAPPSLSGGSNGCANGNTVTGAAGVGVLTYDYEVAEVFADFTTTLGNLPLTVFAQAAENQDPDDLNLAWAAGARLGAASNYRTWEFGAMYQVLEKDALFAQLIDSDFGAGVSDTEGWVFKAGYAPLRNWALNATYFLNKLNVDVANSVGARDVNYDRLQLDFNVKF